jgi:hypothetical protein
MDFLAEGSHELGDIINHNFDSTLHLEQKDDHLKIVGHFIEYNPGQKQALAIKKN